MVPPLYTKLHQLVLTRQIQLISILNSFWAFDLGFLVSKLINLFDVISRYQSFSFIDSVDNVSFVFARHLYNHIVWKKMNNQLNLLIFEQLAIFGECLKLAAR